MRGSVLKIDFRVSWGITPTYYDLWPIWAQRHRWTHNTIQVCAFAPSFLKIQGFLWFIVPRLFQFTKHSVSSVNCELATQYPVLFYTILYMPSISFLLTQGTQVRKCLFHLNAWSYNLFSPLFSYFCRFPDTEAVISVTISTEMVMRWKAHLYRAGGWAQDCHHCCLRVYYVCSLLCPCKGTPRGWG